MPQIFTKTYSGTNTVDMRRGQARFDIASDINGAVLITDISFNFQNIDVYNDDTTTEKFSVIPHKAYTYVTSPGKNKEQAPTVNISNGSSTLSTDEVAGDSSATISGPLKGSVTVNSHDGVYIQDKMTLGLIMGSGGDSGTHGELHFDGSYDWSVELIGRRML